VTIGTVGSSHISMEFGYFLKALDFSSYYQE
jgi:hypothetical protein